MDVSIEKLEQLLTVAQVAELHDVRSGVVRREAKKGNIPGAYQVFGRWGFDPDLVADWTPPEAGTRVVGARREDGRRRFRIYLTDDELAKLQSEGYEVSDPREAARKRRAARKAKAAEAGEAVAAEVDEGENPFADFGTETETE